MRLSLLLFSSLIFFQAYGQYPATGNKQRLGYQTTGDGLVYRGNGSPAYTPSGINSAWAYIDTTAGTIYTYYAGSWHLVSAGGGTSFDGHVDSLVFNTAVTVTDSVGKMYYDAANETISVGIDGGAVYQLGQELYYPLVINKSGATIHNGQPVMVDTATLVSGDHVRIIPARNGATYPSEYVMGVATADIPNDSTGLVTWFGYVREVKEADIAQTSVTLNAGDILYISATEPGKYTNVRPSSPAHQSTVALVVRKPSVNNITLLVRPWLAPKLDNLSNVNVTSVTGLSVLRYNSTTGTWDASATPGIVAADTSAMLSYYLRKADTTAMLVPYQKDITLTTTGTSGAATFNGVTLNVPQYQGVLTNPVTGTGAAGQVSYWSGTGTQAGSDGFKIYGDSSVHINYNNNPLSDFALVVAGKSQKNDGSTIVRFQNPSQFYSSQVNLRFGNTSGQNPYFSIETRDQSSGNVTSKLFFNHTQKIGLLTTSPSYTLDINATDGIRIPSGTTGQRPTGSAGVVRYNTDSTKLEYHNGTSWSGLQSTIANPVTGTGTAGQVSYWSGTGTQAGSNNLFWDNTNARLGIGTNTPERQLDIVGVTRVQRATDDAGVILQRTGTGTKAFLLGVGASGANNGYFTIADGGADGSSGFTRRFYIDNIGRVGIASTSPSYTLDINATDGIRISVGTTAQRPTGASGVVRYNSDSLRLEFHTGTAWKGIAKTEELPVATSGFPRAAPVAVILSTYTVGATDAWIICDYAGTVTLTLPSAASHPGREIMVKTIRAQSVVSASSNVVPIDSNTAGTAILAATAGKWATLVSTGSQWIIMQSN